MAKEQIKDNMGDKFKEQKKNLELGEKQTTEINKLEKIFNDLDEAVEPAVKAAVKSALDYANGDYKRDMGETKKNVEGTNDSLTDISDQADSEREQAVEYQNAAEAARGDLKFGDAGLNQLFSEGRMTANELVVRIREIVENKDATQEAMDDFDRRREEV